MIIQTLERLETLLVQRNQNRDIQSVKQNLDKRSSDISKLFEHWQQLSVLAKEMECIFPDTLQQLRDSCSQLSGSMMRETYTVTRIRSTLNDLEKQLGKVWSERIELMPSSSVSRKASFLSQVGDEQVKRRISALNAKIKRIKTSKDLPTAAAYRLLNESVVELDDLVESNLPEMSVHVEYFFESLVNDRATLNDLTPEVHRWCREHDLMGRIRLGFSQEDKS